MLVSLITPVLNEEDSVKIFVHEIDRTFSALKDDYEIVFIDDGSIDRTVERIVDLKKTYPAIRLIKLSRNFGKEAALSAGLDYAKGDAVIPMDVDLQDPPDMIPELIRTYETGFDVVLARRIERGTDGLIKKYTAVAFYKIIRKLSATNIPENVGDFRIISRKVVDSLKRMKETQRFMKGIFSWPGYKTAYVDYARPMRAAGVTKFNRKKLFSLAVEGITSFSYLPLKIWTFIGLAISLFAFVYASIIVIRTVIYGVVLPGYASSLVAVLFLGGIQLVGFGFLGEYIGRIYMEVKQRPLYLVDEEY